MPKPKKQSEYIIDDMVFDHDSWNYAPPKLPKASALKLGDIHGVLPFDGVRNPSSRSSVSHKIFLPYRTAANEWKLKVGIAESEPEAGTALQILISPKTFDLHFQPLQVKFKGPNGENRTHTFDLMVTFRSGYRRLIYVRNGHSLSKTATQRELDAIKMALPKKVANDMIVVNGDDFSRQRCRNLALMHYFIFNPDDEADEHLLDVVRSGRSFYFMKDLFALAQMPQKRMFAACHRLVAKGYLKANLDNLLWENSRVKAAA
ncbi:hypothetical protein [Pseudotabrizicola algicola]|uniref:hypothetical protein n=1 Tax=Pseudotabrizicola algicola TaxID=2709381 RepID=UPI001966F917|nr:hypothetical protein [Pseudotabrizicola algicola]